MRRTRQVQALDEQLCFALYAASRAMTSRCRPFLDDLGLTYPQYVVMISLWTEGGATVSQLGARLRLDSGTLSPLLKRLEAAGLVARSRRAADERSVEVTLTTEGKRMKPRAAPITPEIVASLRDVDIENLIQNLHELEEQLRA